MKPQNKEAMKTDKKWLIIDAKDQSLGRLASQIAHLLRGKHKPTFVPYLDCGDNVVVINASDVRLTGLKWKEKVYYRHSNYIGGIKAIKAEDLKEKYPERIISYAVKGMLPHNKLGRKLLTNLRVYAGSEHPHVAQKPSPAPERIVGGN